jgi:hypothetical protein
MKQKVMKVDHGVRVIYCGHNGWFIADVYWWGDTCLVHTDGPVSGSSLNRPAVDCDYQLSDSPVAGFWNPQKGIFMVPKSQMTKV